MIKYFYTDEAMTVPGTVIIKFDPSKLGWTDIKGSLNTMAAHILGMKWSDWLRFQRDEYGATIIGKKKIYPVAYLPDNATTKELVAMLNKRMEEIISIKNAGGDDGSVRSLYVIEGTD